MFPLIARLTVAPLFVLAFTVVSDGVVEDDGLGVEVGVTGVFVGFGVDVDVCVDVGEGVGEGVGVGAIVTVNELLVPK
jgi:hypothetical protein